MAVSLPAPIARPQDRRFYSGMSLLIAAIVFAGFARSFYLSHWLDGPALSPLRIVHGLVFSAWIVLLWRKRRSSLVDAETFTAGSASQAPCSPRQWSFWAPSWPSGTRVRAGLRRASRRCLS